MSDEIEHPYNPLDKRNLAESVLQALLNRPVSPLPSPRRFTGAGVYAIYYQGTFEPYAPIAQLNRARRFAQPIYVGKAIPEGGRRGGLGLGLQRTTALSSRLVKHAASIAQAANLSLEDFACRWLVVDDIWIPLGENMLIRVFKPLWNVALDGFGNNDPGRGRYNQRRSPWDTLHPGRPWADRLQPGDRSSDEIVARIAAFLARPELATEMTEQALGTDDDG